jgi:hypothetical protein
MRLFNSILLATALAGCRTLPVTEIPIARGATFDLQSPAALGQEISLEQIVDAKYGEKELSFHCLLEVDAKELVLVGMTPMNTRAFTLTFDGEELSIDVMPGAQLPAPPEHILADLQLALWPEPHVRGLEVAEFEVEDRVRGGSDLRREFSRAEKPVIVIHYDSSRGARDSTQPGELGSEFGRAEPWRRTLVFEHLEQGYTLAVRTLRAEKLEP